MAYTPPASDAVDVEFSVAYTPPASDAVDLDIGAGDVIEVDVIGFSQTSELVAGVYSGHPISSPEFSLEGVLVPPSIALFSLENSVLYYVLVITGGDSHEDIEVPFITCQARRRNGEPTYVSVSIPGLNFAPEINDRADNKFQVYMGYKVDSDNLVRELLLEASLDQINLYKGPLNQSIVLIGYETTSYEQQEISLKKPTYYSLVSGVKRYRFAVPEIKLHPGDVANIGSDSLVVDTVSVYIKNTKSGPINTTEIASA